MTIADIRSMMKRGELKVNHDYQRSEAVWPQSAKSYFIDTILAGFPFPKIYIYVHYDGPEGMEQLREIVDGQQRVMTMMEFLGGAFAVTTSTSAFHRKRYRDLDRDDQQRYLNTAVGIDLVLQAEQSEVLEMFRRMNSYMAPLKPAEKRHAEFTGPFKWFINGLADEYSPVLESYRVLTPKQIVRMGDAEFITELAQVLDVGIVDKSPAALKRIYKDYDDEFPAEDEFTAKLDEFFELMKTAFKPLVGTQLMKSYHLYSLFCALMGRKYGFPGSRELRIRKRGSYFRSRKNAMTILQELAKALADDDEDGEYAEYLAVSGEQTTRKATREPRARILAEYLDE